MIASLMVDKKRLIGPCLIALLGFAGVVVAFLYDGLPVEWLGGTENKVDRAIRQCEPLHKAMPSGMVVGYVSGEGEWTYEWMDRYFAVRYALEPAVVAQERHFDHLIADFKDDAKLQEWLDKSRGYVIDTKTGAGMALVVWKSPSGKRP